MKKKYFSIYLLFLFSAFYANAQNADSIMIRKIADEILMHSKAD